MASRPMLVFGAINLDFVFPVPFLPMAGDTVWSEGGRIAAGGKGVNQAIAASRDGAFVSLGGAVGHDALAATVIAELRRERIGTADVVRVPAATGRAAITLEADGHTTVVADRGANACATASSIPDSALVRGRTLLAQLDTDPKEVALLVMRARRLGVRVILNVAPTRLIDADALRAADVLIGNFEEIAYLGQRLGTANNAASVQAALGVATVRMMGVQGVEAASEDGWLQMPAIPAQMQDTSVAGDCFTGVFAAALHRRADLATALRRAAVAAALSVERIGTGPSIPRHAEIDAALRDAPHPTSKQEEVID